MFSTMWITYRSGFPKMEPYGYTDDSGWGCMLRSAQMLMTQALQRHTLGRYVRLASKGRPTHGFSLRAAAYRYPPIVRVGHLVGVERSRREIPSRMVEVQVAVPILPGCLLGILLDSRAPPSSLEDSIVARRD